MAQKCGAGIVWAHTAAVIGNPQEGHTPIPDLHGDLGSAGVHSVVLSPLQRHSQKPAEVRDRIVELMGDLPRIELFARSAAEGWDCWGNEAPENNTDETEMEETKK